MSSTDHFTPPPDGNSVHSFLDYRLGLIEKTMASISESLKQLAALEQKHAETRESISRAFNEIAEHNVRIREVELALPTIKMTSKWVIAGVLAIFGIFALQVFKLQVGAA